MSRTYMSQEADTATSESNRRMEASVTMVTTPGDGSCGIGTYAYDLLEGMVDVDADTVHIPQDDRSFVDLSASQFRPSAGAGT